MAPPVATLQNNESTDSPESLEGILNGTVATTSEQGQGIHIAYSLDRFPCEGAVPIISIPFDFGRAAASAVHQADVPAGARQGLPVRFDLALHRGAALQRCRD
jgi:hypothetical protein